MVRHLIVGRCGELAQEIRAFLKICHVHNAILVWGIHCPGNFSAVLVQLESCTLDRRTGIVLKGQSNSTYRNTCRVGKSDSLRLSGRVVIGDSKAFSLMCMPRHTIAIRFAGLYIVVSTRLQIDHSDLTIFISLQICLNLNIIPILD